MTQTLQTKAINLAEDLQYQKGSIVSKEILKKPTGTVTLFAFDQGQGLSEHTSPYDALVQILDGESEVRIAGELTRVKKGELILMPAGKPHSLHASKKFKMLLILIRS